MAYRDALAPVARRPPDGSGAQSTRAHPIDPGGHDLNQCEPAAYKQHVG